MLSNKYIKNKTIKIWGVANNNSNSNSNPWRNQVSVCIGKEKEFVLFICWLI
jgi:hypothetical protein